MKLVRLFGSARVGFGKTDNMYGMTSPLRKQLEKMADDIYNNVECEVAYVMI